MIKKHSKYALDLISKLTLEEKIALVSGHNFMYTNSVKRLGIKELRMSDGPHGLRLMDKDSDNQMVGTNKATAFPTAATSSNSFNTELLKLMGEAIGTEANYYGVDILLGPGVNIKRNPLCGRNFEYFSEDPYLSGVLGSHMIEGIQSKGVAVSLKHFALNGEENHRFIGDSVCDIRALREIYLSQFEYIVKNAKPETIMNAYNKVNGIYAGENNYLLNEVLRDEWGYTGLVMSDWGATHNRVLGIKNGCDLEMPGDTLICRKWIKDAIESGELDIESLNERTLNVLDLVSNHMGNKAVTNVDFEANYNLSRLIAEESALLLKNKGLLPLNKKEKVLVIGELFEKMRYQGSGSSMVTPYKVVTTKEAFDNNKVDYVYYKGYEENSSIPKVDLINEAINGSKGFTKALVFIGLTDYSESEGGDRINMSLDKSQLELVDRLIDEGLKLIVVLSGGSAIELPFYDKVESILHMFLPGEAGGDATYNLLFGNVSPSGKLSETWPLRYEDVPFYNEFGQSERQLYKESIYVGYRYYLTKGVNVRFPFGYGLSYSQFNYSDLKVNQNENEIIINLKVTNKGNYCAKEIIEVYVKSPNTEIFYPLRELKGFTKVSINIGETKDVLIHINKDSLGYFNVDLNRRVLESGEYIIEVGQSSDNILLEAKIYINGEIIKSPYSKNISDIYHNLRFENITDDVFQELIEYKLSPLNPKKPIHLESRLLDLRQTFMGRILYNAVINVPKKELKKAMRMPESIEKENMIKGALSLHKMLETNSLITMTMSAGNSFPYNFAEGFMNFSNFHIIKGIKNFTTKIDAPKLPDEEER